MNSLVPVIVAGLTPIVILGLLVSGVAFGLVEWQPPVLWTNRFNALGPCYGSNGVARATSDSTGVYVGGFVGGPSPCSVINPPSPSYTFVSKYDPGGHQVWSAHLGDPRWVQIPDMALSTNGLYMVVATNNSARVEKYTLNGNEVWSSNVANQTNTANRINGTAISTTPTGLFAATIAGHAVVARDFDSMGNILWNRTLAGVPAQVASPIAVYSDVSGIYVAGSGGICLCDTGAFLSGYDTSGTLKWTRQFDQPPDYSCFCEPNRIVRDMTGIYVAGQTWNAFPGQSSGGIGDVFARKYDTNGNVLWTTQISPPDHAGFLQPALSEDSQNLYLGMTTVAGHSFVMKYNNNGDLSWSLQVGGQSVQGSVTVAGFGSGLYVGGIGAGSNAEGFLEQVAGSSSLVLFGLNPPFSFVVVAILAGIAVLSILYYRQRQKRRPRRIVATSLASKRIPADAASGLLDRPTITSH